MTTYRSPFSKRFAIGQGIMGAILGGLKYQLDLNTQQLAEQAELEKEQRLAAIQQQNQIAQEGRANTEWTRRNDVENQQALARDDRTTDNNIRQSDHTLGNELKLSDHNTGNDIVKTKVESGLTLTREQQMEQQRAADARQQAAFEAQQQRLTHVHNETFDAVAAAKDPAHYGNSSQGDGLMGSDGKFYPKGTSMPNGVTPTVGFGATNLGTRGTQSGRLGTNPRTGAPAGTATNGVAAPATNMATVAHPQSQQDYAALPSGTRYIAPDGTIRTKP